MFDFIKSYIHNKLPQDFINNPLLNFKFKVDRDAVIENIKIAEYNNLTFKIIDEKHIYLNGSVHKYFNCGFHNHNDFTISNFVEVCISLSENFDLNPYLTSLHNLEFGVNVILPFNTNDVLNSIISYKGKEYEIEMFNGKGYLIRFTFDQYELKIYNKGFQYQLNDNVLRFEIKAKKMEYFKKRGIDIKCLPDLLNRENYSKLKYCLLKAFKELVIYDNTIKLKGLPQREKTVLINGKNPKYWTELKQQGKEIKKIRNRFNELVLKYGTQNLKETIYNLIENKINEITKIDTPIEQNIANYLNLFNNQTLPKVTTFESAEIKPNLTQCNTSNIGELMGVFNRYCLTCGRDVSNQRKNSVFCSEKLYGKEAKKCRNVNSNPRNNYKLKEKSLYSGELLFDVNKYKNGIAV